MAKYNLLCTNDHTFEGWFASEKDYLQQKRKKMIACPMCDDTQIRRALMAPNISKKYFFFWYPTFIYFTQ